MNISKKRLVQIIKEELAQESPSYYPPAKDVEANQELDPDYNMGAASDPTATAANILSIIDNHSQPDQVIESFVGLLSRPQKEYFGNAIIGSLMGGRSPQTTPQAAADPAKTPSEYGAETGMGFVKTREDLERMIGNELATLLQELNENETD